MDGLKACTSLGFLPRDNCSGHSEKQLIHSCLETWFFFFLTDSNCTSSGKAVFPYPEYQMSVEGRNPRTKHMAEKAGGGREMKPAGRLWIWNGFYYSIKMDSAEAREKTHHFISKALLSSYVFLIFRLRISQGWVILSSVWGQNSLLIFGSVVSGGDIYICIFFGSSPILNCQKLRNWKQ